VDQSEQKRNSQRPADKKSDDSILGGATLWSERDSLSHHRGGLFKGEKLKESCDPSTTWLLSINSTAALESIYRQVDNQPSDHRLMGVRRNARICPVFRYPLPTIWPESLIARGNSR
jgi:hypothetical protein